MREPLYSGPNRSGMCICGHSWQQHHLCLVMQQDKIDETGEAYIPCECVHFGSNEAGGLEYKDGEYIDHCFGYKDTNNK